MDKVNRKLIWIEVITKFLKENHREVIRRFRERMKEEMAKK